MFVFVHGYDFLRAKVITLRYRIISKPTMNFTVHTLNFMAQAPTTELNLQLKQASFYVLWYICYHFNLFLYWK